MQIGLEIGINTSFAVRAANDICTIIDGFIFKGRLQWKNDLGLYFSLVLVMKIGMCDLVIFRLV